MGMQNNGWQSVGARLEDLSNIWPFSVGAPISRASLLATASPSAAQAFGGTNQIISGPVVGPIDSNGGAITVTGTGSISGAPGGDGVDAVNFPITELTNQLGGRSAAAAPPRRRRGGAGVANTNTITLLSNSGAISGGSGGAASAGFYRAAWAARAYRTRARLRACPTAARSTAEPAAPPDRWHGRRGRLERADDQEADQQWQDQRRKWRP